MAEESRVVAGVITVQAPNLGSPLANKANADNASLGLLGAVLGLARFPILDGLNANTRHAAEALVRGASEADGFRVGVGAVALLDDAVIEDVDKLDPKKADLERTMRKWLTGLRPTTETPTAFDDLDPTHLDDPTTILGRLQTLPLSRTWHGAVIGCDTEIDDLVVGGLPCYERWIARWLLRKHWLGPIQLAYARIAMNEPAGVSGSGLLHSKTNDLYREGVASAEVTLEAYKHDFVIPSVSQAFYALSSPSPTSLFLGNAINPKGTHISGGDESDGDSDKRLVIGMLRALGRRL
jgi:hypothetical protein